MLHVVAFKKPKFIPHSFLLQKKRKSNNRKKKKTEGSLKKKKNNILIIVNCEGRTWKGRELIEMFFSRK
jgi:hypothetical protein